MSSRRIVHGDCLDSITGLASLPDKSVDHFISDPPFEIEAHRLQVRPSGSGRENSRPEAVDIGVGHITEEQRAELARQAARLARRWVIVFCQAEAIAAWRSVFESAGLGWRRAGIWIKENPQPQMTGDRPGQGYESLAIAHAKGNGRSRWNGGGHVGIWTSQRSMSRDNHPTQKPLEIMECLVRDFTDSGEVICDPFTGSGTTGVACKRLGRNFIGWEREEKWATAAQKRIDATREQMRLFEGAAL